MEGCREECGLGEGEEESKMWRGGGQKEDRELSRVEGTGKGTFRLDEDGFEGDGREDEYFRGGGSVAKKPGIGN
jgi:hypothetical protein